MPTAELSARRDAGGGLLLVALDVDADLARAYTAPGQYIEVTTSAGGGYFVLGGAASASPWQLLVKNAGGAADALFTLSIGSAVEVSRPMGAGFPVARAGSRPVVVAVVASALAVARPIMDLRIGEGVAHATFLFVGLRAPTDLPIADEVTVWSEQGVNVVLCLSRCELAHHAEVVPRAKRVAGYVQGAVARAVEEQVVPPNALVVAAGPDLMLADLRAFAATHAGVPPLEVVTNV